MIIQKEVIFLINRVHTKVKIKVNKDFFQAFDSLVKSFLHSLEERNRLARSDNAQKGVVTA